MKNKIKVILSCLIAILGFLSILIPSSEKMVTAESQDVIYIKNSYTVGAYLYEDYEGTLRYGIPLKNEQSFQWIVNETEKGVTIQNKFTNHYITLKSFLGNPTDPIKVLDFDANDDRFYWDMDITLEPTQSQNIASSAFDYEGTVLHLEGITNGQVAAEKLSGDNLSWGNVRWLLLPETLINFDAIIRDGFVLRSDVLNQYVYENLGALQYGVPTSPDEAFIWIIEPQADGSKRIKNKKSGNYISMATYHETSFAVNMVSSLTNDLETWDFSISINSIIKSSANTYADYGLTTLDVTATNVIAQPLTSIAFANKSWSIIPAASVKNAVGDLILEDRIYNLKNAWFSMYLIEDNGMATYGNASPSDPYAQWKLIYDIAQKKTALQNVGSGNYLHSGNGQNGLVIDATESYYWNLLRNQSDQYPEAVVFQDSTDSTKYLHMESLNGYAENSYSVQPTWGTPHWIPLVYDASSPNVSFSITTIDDRFVRIQSVYGKDLYLYETAAGGLAYGDVKESDARSHWQFEATENGYFLKNRKYENYFANMGNGVMRAFKDAGDITSGGLFVLLMDESTNQYVIRNQYDNLKDYLQPYVNISSMTGLAKSSLVPLDAKTTKWIVIDAPEVEDENTESTLGNVDLPVFPDTNIYQIQNGTQTLEGYYSVEYYGTNIRLKKEGTQSYLSNQSGSLVLNPINNPYDSRILFSMSERLGTTIAKNTTLELELTKVASKSVYPAKYNFVSNNQRTFSVYTSETKNYTIELGLTSPMETQIFINGIAYGTYSSSNNAFPFHKGINTLKVSNGNNVQSLTIFDSINASYRGVSADYQLYEAEMMQTNGTLLDPSREYRTIASESTHRSAVILNRTAQYVKFVLSEDTNALVLRYSIPDSKDGVGQDATLNLYIDGSKKMPINLTSRFSHLYGAYPWSNDPSDGNLHAYYDEVKIPLDRVYPKGTEIKLQKDVANYAESYVIDLVEGSFVEAANIKPTQSLSITDFGAIANDGQSDYSALLATIEAAHASNKEVWIPAGVFDMNGSVTLSYDNTVIRGAGYWHTTIQGGVNFFINANNTGFYDMYFSGIHNVRRDAEDRALIEVKKQDARGVVIQNLWINHYKVGFWLSYIDDVHIVGNRVRYTYADGLNLHAGVVNAVVEQNDFVSTGDDTIGLWSQGASNINIVIKYNTIRSPWLANAVGVYGGTNITIIDNIMQDTIYAGAGVNISTNFQPNLPAGNIRVLRNSILRAGSDNNNGNVGGIWFNTVLGYDNKAINTIEDNLILDSSYQGISFAGGGMVKDVRLEHNVVLNSGTWGLEVLADASGSVVARDNVIERSMLEDVKNNSNRFTMDIEVNYIKANPIDVTEWTPLRIALVAALNATLIAAIVGISIYLRKMIIKAKKEMVA